MTATESPSESIPWRHHSASASSNGRTPAQKEAASARSASCSAVGCRCTAARPYLGGLRHGAPARLHHRGRRHAARGAALAARRAPGTGRDRGAPVPDGRPNVGLRSEYERLCEEGGFAVCRLDIRGTGSSEGIATDEYTAAELDDICQVIAWLAEQEWSNGRVGMYGTSWSGFNSLQVACLRPPALHAIVPIYASDDRYNDDVHYMGGALKAIDLIDYELYMVAGNALPPVPAVFGPGWREQWERRVDDAEPWLLRWIEEQVDGPYWRHGSVRPDYDRIIVPDDDRGGLGRRLHEHRLPRLRGALVPEARDPRAVGARLDRHRAARAAHRPRPGADPLVPPLARRTRRTASTRSRRSRCSPAARPCRRRIAPRCAASGAARRPGRRSGSPSRCCGPTARAPTRSTSAATSARWPGSRAPGSSRGGCPTTSASTTPSRSPTTGSRWPRIST